MPTFNPPIIPIASPAPQRRIIVKPPASPSNNHRQHYGQNLQPPSPTFSPTSASSPGKRRKEVGDYWLGKTLGKGSSGRVKLGIHKVSGEKVAIKIISKSHLASNASVERAVKREIAVMKLIHHPNIMSLLDVIDLSDSPNLYLVLEYVQGGELFEYLVSQGRLPEHEARKYFQQIIFGLDYCHRHLICHRDLKPENLLLDKDKNIKIADFGMASLQPTGSLLETSCGSPHYASPEIVTGVPYNGSASDIWSCGIILYALLCGHLPFDDDNMRELLNKVKIGKYKMPDHISESARDLIQKILVIQPEKRFTMKQVQEHPWFNEEPAPNPSILPDPPSASEIGRPVSDASEIDERLLETLKVLWTDLTTEQVIEALLNDEYNMQKVTYVLLQRHANSYWQHGHEEEIPAASPAKRRRPATICVAPNKAPLPGLDDMMHKIAEKEEQSSSFAAAMSPGPQRHSMQPQQFPRHNSPTRLQPIRTEEKDTQEEDTPPPVPPKPIVIRGDLGYEKSRADLSRASKSPRPPSQWPYAVQHPHQRQDAMWRQNMAAGSPSVNRRAVNRPAQQIPVKRYGMYHMDPQYSPMQQQQQVHHHQQQQQIHPPYPPPPPSSQHYSNSPQQHFHHHPQLQPHQYYAYGYTPQFQQQIQPQQQQQQHMHIAHMLSPRVPVSHVMRNSPFQQRGCAACTSSSCQTAHHHHRHHLRQPSANYAQYTQQQQQPPQYSPEVRLHQDASAAGTPSSKMNKFKHLLQKSRVEPVLKSPKVSHRLSMPPPAVQNPMMDYHHNEQPITTQPGSPYIVASSRKSSVPSHPLMQNASTSLACEPRTAHSSRHVTTSAGSPRLSSWLPGLFHFKQPRVCSIDCIARDEREAIGKISQVLEECMDGVIIERQDSDGHIRRKGEMTLPGNDTTTKPIHLRFKLDVSIPPQMFNKPRTVRVSFIQQQGDAVALMTAVRMVERALQAYEQEANLIATANGWTLQPTYS